MPPGPKAALRSTETGGDVARSRPAAAELARRTAPRTGRCAAGRVAHGEADAFTTFVREVWTRSKPLGKLCESNPKFGDGFYC